MLLINSNMKPKKDTHNVNILSKSYGISLDDVNHSNTCVIDTGTAGDAEIFKETNILNTDVSFVCMDTSGSMYQKTAQKLEEKGYEVYKIDLNNDKDSDGINICDDEKYLSFTCDKIAGYYFSDSFFRQSVSHWLQIGLCLNRDENKHVRNLMEYISMDKNEIENIINQSMFSKKRLSNIWESVKHNFQITQIELHDQIDRELISNNTCLLKEFETKAFTKGTVPLKSFKHSKCALFVIPKDDNLQTSEWIFDIIIDKLIACSDNILDGNPIHIIYDRSGFGSYPLSNLLTDNLIIMKKSCVRISFIVRSLDEFTKLDINGYLDILLLFGESAILQNKKHSIRKRAIQKEHVCKIVMLRWGCPQFSIFDKKISS